METKLFFPNSKGNKLCAILSDPTEDKTKPIIIMMHGFASNKDTAKNLEFQKLFNQAGIATFRVDFFGHGESEGAFEDITVSEGVDDILQAIAYLKEQGYTKIGLTGSSFGGICSMVAASETHDLFVLGLICPVSNLEEIERNRKSEISIDAWQKTGYRYFEKHTGEKLQLKYAYFEDAVKNLGYDAAPKITVPTIIVHGDADTNVPIEQSQKTSKLIPDCKLVVIPGADHRFTEEKHFDQLIKAISEFVIEKAL